MSLILFFYYKHDNVLLILLWKIAIVQQTVNFISCEPAGRTMQPPPRELLRVGSFLRNLKISELFKLEDPKT